MKIDRTELEARFRDMPNEELLRHATGDDLTPLALDVLKEEAARRGLHLEVLREAADAQGLEVAHGHGPLCICARYLNPLDAQVLIARLQAEGLAAQSMDADTIYANGVFPYALTLGGIRVMVPQSQLAEAQRIRAAVDAGEYAIDEDFDVGTER